MAEITLTLDSDPTTVLVTSPGGDSEYIIRAAIRQPMAAPAQQPALIVQPDVDFCLLIDNSLSMLQVASEVFIVSDKPGQNEQGEGPSVEVKQAPGVPLLSVLDMCKEGAQAIIDVVARNDTISVVAFADDARPIVQRLTAADTAAKEQAKQAIDNVRASGDTTRMELGLSEAFRQLGAPAAGRIRKIVILTDGNPTRENDALEVADIIAKHGVTIDVYGIGKIFNLALMQKLVTASNGKCGAVSSPKALTDIFTNQFDAAKKVVASGLQLEFFFDPAHVRLLEAYRGSPHNSFYGTLVSQPGGGGDRYAVVAVGNLEERQLIEVFVKAEVIEIGEAVPKWRFVEASLSYELPRERRTGDTAHASLEVPIVADVLDHQQSGDSEIRTGFLLAETQKFQAERAGLIEQLVQAKNSGTDLPEVRRRAIALTARIKENFEKAKRPELAQNEAQYLATLTAGGILTNEELSKSSSSSTLPANAAPARAPRAQTLKRGRNQ